MCEGMCRLGIEIYIGTLCPCLFGSGAGFLARFVFRCTDRGRESSGKDHYLLAQLREIPGIEESCLNP